MDGNYSINNKKRYKIGVFVALTLFFSMLANILLIGFNPNKLSAHAGGSASIVMEVSSKRVLKGTNYNQRLPMASTTKAMTALVVIENCDMSEIVTIPKAAVGIEGSSIYLIEGEKLTVKDLLYGLMLRSGNDAATALAIHVGKSVEGFSAIMNQKAEELGLTNTNFTNPHGLHDDNHYTSAYDLAVISCVGMENETFKEIVSTKNIVIKSENNTRYFSNKNKILSTYNGGNGIKTGFTKAAGRCLISSSMRDDMQVVAVVLNHPDMFSDCAYLMDYAYENYSMCKLTDKNNPIAVIPVEKSKQAEAKIYIDKDFYYPLKSDNSEKVDINYHLPDSIKAPHKMQDTLGSMEIKLGNRLLFSQKLYTMEDIKEKTLFERFKDSLKIGKKK